MSSFLELPPIAPPPWPPPPPPFDIDCPTEYIFYQLQGTLFKDASFNFDLSPALRIILPVILLPTSLLLLGFGRFLVRTAFTLVGFSLGSAVSMYFLYSGKQYQFPCEAAVAVVLVISLIVALIAACLVRFATFALGFVGGGVTVFSIFLAAPVLNTFTLGTPLVLGYPLLPFWASIVVVGGIFGLIAMRYKSLTAIIITSILGGYALPFALRIITQNSLPMWAHVTIFAACALSGVLWQLLLDRRTRWRTRRKARAEAAAKKRGVQFDHVRV